MIHQIAQPGGGVQDPLPSPQPCLARSTKGILRDPVWQLHDLASAVGVPLVHAAEKVAKRMIGIVGIVLVHPVDRAGDLGDGHSLPPHLGNPLIRKRSILTPLPAPWLLSSSPYRSYPFHLFHFSASMFIVASSVSTI